MGDENNLLGCAVSVKRSTSLLLASAAVIFPAVLLSLPSNTLSQQIGSTSGANPPGRTIPWRNSVSVPVSTPVAAAGVAVAAGDGNARVPAVARPAAVTTEDAAAARVPQAAQPATVSGVQVAAVAPATADTANPAAAPAQSVQNDGGPGADDRIWVLWERSALSPDCTDPAVCGLRRAYRSLYSRDMRQDDMAGIVQILGETAIKQAGVMTTDQQAPWSPDALQTREEMHGELALARARVAELEAQLEAAVTAAEVAVEAIPDEVVEEPEDPLATLEGVYFSASSILVPESYGTNFRKDLEKQVEIRLRSAGLRMLTAEERDRTEDRPVLRIALEPGNARLRCPVPYFAQISVRRILEFEEGKENVGVPEVIWAGTASPSATDPTEDEYTGILRVVDQFVTEVQAAKIRIQAEEMGLAVEGETDLPADVSVAAVAEAAGEAAAEETAAGDAPVTEAEAAAAGAQTGDAQN